MKAGILGYSIVGKQLGLGFLLIGNEIKLRTRNGLDTLRI